MAAPGQGPDPPIFNDEPIPAIPLNAFIEEDEEDEDPWGVIEDPEQDEDPVEEEEDPEEIDSGDESCITYEYIPTPPRPPSIPQSPPRPFSPFLILPSVPSPPRPAEIPEYMLPQYQSRTTLVQRPRDWTPPRETQCPRTDKGKDIAGPSGTKPVGEVSSSRYTDIPVSDTCDMYQSGRPTVVPQPVETPVHRFGQRDFQTYEQLLAQMRWFARYIRRDGRQPMNVYLDYLDRVRQFYDCLREDGVPVDPETFVRAMTQVLPTNEEWTRHLTYLDFTGVYQVEDWLKELEIFVIDAYM